MFRRRTPSIGQANILFFITAVITVAGSALLQPVLGIGTNLWINEYVYILAPPLLLALCNKWDAAYVYRFRKTSARNNIISIFSGVSLWIPAYYISRVTRMLLDNRIGTVAAGRQLTQTVYQGILLIVGMIILAPICEEIFFRGLVQRAYEGRSRKYAFIIAGVIFGSYHILNGISEVMPACILGIAMGYLVHKTDSIASSMLFHAAANAAAVVLGAVFDAAAPAAIPPWLHGLAAVGPLIALLLMKNLKTDTSVSAEQENAKVDKGKLSATGIVFFVLAAVFLIAMGIFEIAARV